MVTSDNTMTSIILSAINAQSPAAYLPSNTHPTLIEGYTHQVTALKNSLYSNSSAVFEYPIAFGNMIAFLKPLSRGNINISPTDPLAEPLVSYRTFTNPIDVTMSMFGTKVLRRLYALPALKAYGPTEQAPGSKVQTNAEWEDWLRKSMSPSFYHPVGTASLGRLERGGVVGPDLRVHGVQGLRVIDASGMLFPVITMCMFEYVC